ncbi:MAG: hypothetical protein ACJ77Z_17140 [Thermoleophilaceae bacterium]
MSTLAIVVLVLLGILILLFIGGLIAARRHARATEEDLHRRITAADRALEAARAADRGWDPVLMEEAARKALELAAPGWQYDALHLVLVDDRPGTEADRAEMVAAGRDRVVRIAVTRRGDIWVGELIS